MLQITSRYVQFDFNFNQRNTINFAENHYLDQEK